MTSDKEDISSEPDFSDFADWHVKEQKEPWPLLNDFGSDLSVAQERIIDNNASLLKNRADWTAKVTRFSKLINSISDDEERARTLKQFEIRFDNYKFDHAEFYNYSFPCSTSFSGAVFKDFSVNFIQTVFKESVSFEGAEFINASANFHGMRVLAGDFYFSHVYMERMVVNFFAARILGDIAEFDFMTLEKSTFSADEVKIKGHLFIKNTTFPKRASFCRLSVGGACDLSKNTFHDVPDFTNSIFDRPPDVSGMEILSFQMKWISPWWIADKDEGAKFRKLKAMAQAANDHEKDGEFFAYEMLAKRGYELGSTEPFALFVNWLYFTFSKFGHSYVRPAIALDFNFFIFFVFNAIVAAPYLKPSDLSAFAFWQSFKNMIPFLNSLIRFASRPDEFKSTYELAFNQLQVKGAPIEFFIYAGIFQNFIGLIFLFLLLLGLRNKFRLK